MEEDIVLWLKALIVFVKESMPTDMIKEKKKIKKIGIHTDYFVVIVDEDRHDRMRIV